MQLTAYLSETITNESVEGELRHSTVLVLAKLSAAELHVLLHATKGDGTLMIEVKE